MKARYLIIIIYTTITLFFVESQLKRYRQTPAHFELPQQYIALSLPALHSSNNGGHDT